MINASNLDSLIGANVIDSDGDKIGSVGQVYVDTDSGAPTWVSVRTGLFGMSETFVPIDQADQTGEDLRVPFTKEFVKDAPRIDVDGALEHSQEDELYAYYGSGSSGDAGRRTGTADYDRRDDTTVGYDTSGPTTDDAMTRSEERLHVGTEKVETGRARLRKYVVTENETVTVPVTREEVRVEREPITDGNVGDALSGPDISEEEHEVVLTEERPVVAKETVPVERVRLDTETVTENETVSEQVRKEEIEYEDGTDRTDRTDRI
jgi:uncharacterized protein (TIGR02271 family)